MKKSQWYPVVGFLIGWGAPLGAVILRSLYLEHSSDLVIFVQKEWADYSFFYWYMLVGTCLVLTYVGFLFGRHEDREAARHQERIGS